MNERLLSERVTPQSSIRALIDNPPGKPSRESWDEPDEADGLASFSADASTYQVHARPVTKMLPSVHFIFKDRTIRTCQYTQLESDSRFSTLPQGKGNRLVFRFAGSVAVQVVIEGRNLWKLYDYLSQHRMAWVHELPAEKDFEGDEAPVVHSIAFEADGSGI